MRIPFNGEISRICFDYGLTLLSISGSEIRFETVLSIGDEQSPPLFVDPSEAAEHAQIFVRLLHQIVTSAEAAEDGTLSIDFLSKTRIVVSPDARYEAWTFADPKGKKAVCIPGGGLTTWLLGE